MQEDAAWKNPGNIAGFGWNIIDGTLSFTFSGFDLNVQSSLLAEGMAMREAMIKCIELGLVAVCFESDSSQLINAINEEKMEIYGVVSALFCQPICHRINIRVYPTKGFKSETRR